MSLGRGILRDQILLTPSFKFVDSAGVQFVQDISYYNMNRCLACCAERINWSVQALFPTLESERSSVCRLSLQIMIVSRFGQFSISSFSSLEQWISACMATKYYFSLLKLVLYVWKRLDCRFSISSLSSFEQWISAWRPTQETPTNLASFNKYCQKVQIHRTIAVLRNQLITRKPCVVVHLNKKDLFEGADERDNNVTGGPEACEIDPHISSKPKKQLSPYPRTP